MTPTATAEIERLAREAPAGPWYTTERDDCVTVDAYDGDVDGDGRHIVVHETICMVEDGRLQQETAAYIAAVSPDVVLGLIAEHRAAVERAEYAENALHEEGINAEQYADEAYTTNPDGTSVLWSERAQEANSFAMHWKARANTAEAALRAAEAERDAARADRDSHQRIGIAAMASLTECAKFLEIFEDTVWDWHINEQSSKRAAATKLRVDEFNAVLARARAALQSTSAKEDG